MGEKGGKRPQKATKAAKSFKRPSFLNFANSLIDATNFKPENKKKPVTTVMTIWI